jgi:hypothetical protein
MGPIAVGALAAVAVWQTANLIAGVGEQRTRKVVFTCKPWEPPIGGNNCDLCNEASGGCTEYKCKSLGAGCEFINKGSENELCVWNNPGDVSPPQISAQLEGLESGIDYVNINSQGFSIKPKQETCFEENGKIPIQIKTTEPARCRYDTRLVNYEEMEYEMSSYYSLEHKTEYLLSPQQSETNEETRKINFYVMCADVNNIGAQAGLSYQVSACVGVGEDVQPPKIEFINPASESYINLNTSEQEVSLFVNEPAECRWDIEDKEYDLMKNSFNCKTDYSLRTILGWECSSKLKTSSDRNQYYIRCKDQPDLEIINQTVDLRNTNEQSYSYLLRKSKDALKIDSISPRGNINTETSSKTISLSVKTSGGVLNPICSYSFKNFEESLIQFKETNSDTHTQEFSLPIGEYDIYVVCQDGSGNIIKEQNKINIGKDLTPLILTGVYREENNVVVRLSKKAECIYSIDINKKCDYSSNEGKILGEEQEYKLPLTGHTYYIKCRDSSGNFPEECTGVVRATK